MASVLGSMSWCLDFCVLSDLNWMNSFMPRISELGKMVLVDLINMLCTVCYRPLKVEAPNF